MSSSLLILAQAQAAPGGGLQVLVPIALMAGVVYLLLWRPQQKQIREHRALIASLKKGDDVITQGGILGKIYAVSEREVQLEVAAGVRIRMLKTSIQGKRGAEEPAAPTAKSEEAKEAKEEKK